MPSRGFPDTPHFNPLISNKNQRVILYTGIIGTRQSGVPIPLTY